MSQFGFLASIIEEFGPCFLGIGVDDGFADLLVETLHPLSVELAQQHNKAVNVIGSADRLISVGDMLQPRQHRRRVSAMPAQDVAVQGDDERLQHAMRLAHRLSQRDD